MEKLKVIEKVKEILDTKTWLKKDSEGNYTEEIHVDYRDMYIEDKSLISELVTNGEDYIFDKIAEWTIDSDIEEYSCIKEVLKDNLAEGEYDAFEDEINEFIYENIRFIIPDDYVWGTEVLVNIVLTSYGDDDVEFTENAIYTDEFEAFKIGNGGIKWLIEQQGYSVKNFEKELNIQNEEFSNKFFKTIYNEMLNTTTSLNALVVSTKMSLRELIKMRRLQENKEIKSIKLDKLCDVGLVDFWMGAGSILEITLENNLEIPIENIHRIDIDSNFYYGIASIYGHDEHSYWNEVEYTLETV